MFSEYKQDTLKDLIRKYRQTSSTQNIFISKAITSIKQELQSQNKDTKINALLKLIFLYLHNNDIQWASFNTLELISTSNSKGKVYAYLIASIQFKNNDDFIQLLPNQIRSDLHKQDLNNINISLNCVNSIMNNQISLELLKDFESQLNLNNTLIRKKTIIALTLACEKFAISQNNFAYWEDYLIKLISILGMKDTVTSITLCIIASIQKMCAISPQHCMTIFVELMNYFTKCEVNWNLIKIVDIFRMLFKHQPKFTKKKEFIKILSEQLVKTKSKSVEAELVKLIITNFNPETNSHCSELVLSCEEKLKSLLFSTDNNLIVISLKILHNIQNKINYLNDILKIIESHNNNRHILIECVKILKEIANSENYKSIVEVIYKMNNIIGKPAIESIAYICTRNNYEIIADNKESLIWFTNIILDMGYQQILSRKLKDSNINNDNINKHFNDNNNSMEIIKIIANILRDLSQRIEILRNDMCKSSIVYLQKIFAIYKEQSRDKLKQNEENTDNNNNDSTNIKYVYLNNEHNMFYDVNYNSDNNHINVIYIDLYMLNVLLFIIGEYCNKSILKSTFETLITLIQDNFEVIQNHNMLLDLIIAIMKLLIKCAELKNEELTVNITKITESLKLFNLKHTEEREWISYFENIVSNETSPQLILMQLKESFNKMPMNPLATNAYEMVLPSKDLDLNIPLQIKEDELDIGTSTKKHKNKNNKEKETINENSNTTTTSEQQVKIDTTLYTPPTNK